MSDDLEEVVFFSNMAVTVQGTASRLFKIETLKQIRIVPNSVGWDGFSSSQWAEKEPSEQSWDVLVSLGTAAEAMISAAGGGSIEIQGDTALVEVASGCVIHPTLIPDASFYDRLFNGERIAQVPDVEAEAGVRLHVYERDSVPWIVIKEMVRRGVHDKVTQENVQCHQDLWPFDLIPCLTDSNICPEDPEERSRFALDHIDSSSHLALLTVSGKDISDWIKLGMTLQRFLLACSALSIVSALINPEDISSELKDKLELDQSELPALLLRLGYRTNDDRVQMPCMGVKDVLIQEACEDVIEED